MRTTGNRPYRPKHELKNEFVDATYGEFLSRIAEQYAHRDALVFEHRRYTFAEVKAEIDAASARLASLRLKMGDTVSIWLPNRPEFIWYWLGAAQMGLVPVLLNTRLRNEEVAYQLRQSDSRALIVAGCGTSFREFLRDTAELVPEVRTGQPGALGNEDFPALTSVICCDPPGQEWRGVLDWSGAPPEETPPPPPVDDPKQAAMIVYSSGTTSLPKGVLLNHCACQKAWDAGQRVDLTENDKLYLSVPLFGVFANINGVIVFWARGAAVVLEAGFDPEAFLAKVQAERCTAAYLLSPMVYKIVNHPDFQHYDLSSLRTGTIVSTEPEVFELAVEKLGLRQFISSYGLSETHAVVTRTRWDDSLEVRLGSHGKPIPGVEVRVIDPESGVAASTGEPGEIQVRGYTLFLGYYKRPEATAEAFTPDGWFRTGDAGVLNADGTLTFKYRLGDGYKHKGFNVSPAEVEDAVARHPAVAGAQVVGLPDKENGYDGAVFVIPKDGYTVTLEELHAFLRPSLASFKLPRYAFEVKSFPLTSGTEKVQKYKLRELALARLGGENTSVNAWENES